MLSESKHCEKCSLFDLTVTLDYMQTYNYKATSTYHTDLNVETVIV